MWIINLYLAQATRTTILIIFERALSLSRAIHTCVYATGRMPHYFDSFSLSYKRQKKKRETRTSMGTPSGIGPSGGVVASTLVYAVRIARRHSAFGDRPFVCWFTRPSVCSSATPFPQLGSRSSEARKRDGTLASICYLEPRGCNPSFLIFPHLLFLRVPRENPRLSPTKRAPLSSTPPLPSWRLFLFFVCFGTIKNETRRYARKKTKTKQKKTVPKAALVPCCVVLSSACSFLPSAALCPLMRCCCALTFPSRASLSV